ncbi:hypothetical protein ACP70R_010233 [Stipagrostis hirtigluma subsp. patula]
MQRQLSLSAMPKLLTPEECSVDDDVEAKPEKAPVPRSSAAKERFVHLIPLLTVLCFLLLFLCSHEPSPSDMSSFGKKAGSRKTRLL